ncbi:MAG: EamA family transporter [Rhizobiales bacterium]|nr:EamA family transporter [Hyphomicrobiales bacterium]
MARPLTAATGGASPAAPIDESARWRIGIIMMIGGAIVGACNGAQMKLLAGGLNDVMVVWGRTFGSALMMLPIAIWLNGGAVWKPSRPGLQIVRGLMICGSALAFMASLHHLGLAESIAILYVYPFLMTALAAAFLGERVRGILWLGIMGGFAGVLIVMRPSTEAVNIGALFALLCGALVAVQLFLNRKLGPLSPAFVTAFWGHFIASTALLAVLPFYWTTPTWPQVGALALVAVTTGGSQLLFLTALARAPVGLLAPFSYVEIVAAILLGYVIFGAVPDLVSWLGISLIVVSGVLVALHRNTPSAVIRPRRPVA